MSKVGVRGARLVPGFFLVIGVATGCTDDEFLEPPRECAGPLSLTVSSGTPPQFTWTVPCAVARVVVLEPAGQGGAAIAWAVRSAPPRIVSPVRYGERRSGATEEQPPAALRSGETYEVRVFNEAQIVIGTASFTP